LTILFTIVTSESACSIEGHVIDPFRSSLAPKTVKALLCTRKWLKSSLISEHDESHLPSIEDEESYKIDSSNIFLISYLFIMVPIILLN
jgi:hypothetical protein